MLEPEWQGRRVVVRRVVSASAADATGGSAGRVYSDVLGDLVALEPAEIAVETRQGREIVRRDQIASARLVLPSAAAVLALEATSARGWRPSQVETSADGWLLRADRGWTGRANSALALRTLHRPLGDVLADVSGWYGERGLPPRIQIPQPAGGALGLALGRLGWKAADHTDVLIGRLDLLALAGERLSADRDDDPGVDFEDEPDREWLDAYHYRGGKGLPPGAAELLSRHDRVVFARVRRGGRTVAIGRGAVDDGWLGITAVDVDVKHRRDGLGAAVTIALGRWGASRGATRAYLQTDETNGPGSCVVRTTWLLPPSQLPLPFGPYDLINTAGRVGLRRRPAGQPERRP